MLRQEVFDAEITEGDYLLIYLLNKGYAEDIIRWHNSNPHVKLHCFADDKNVKDSFQYDDTLTFHAIEDRKFLELMTGAKGLITTSGFESVCEDMYLGKPVFMVPVKGHFEQYYNSRNAFKAGAGIYDDTFNIDMLLTYSPRHHINNSFQHWVRDDNRKTLDELAELLYPTSETVSDPVLV